MIYWDARASAHQPTLEFRIADATADGRPPPAVRTELLTAARWRAARSGLEGPLLDVLAGELVPPGVLVDRLLSAVRPALEQEGDWDEVAGLAAQAGKRPSALRQRQAYARAGDLGDVVDLLVGETCAGDA